MTRRLVPLTTIVLTAALVGALLLVGAAPARADGLPCAITTPASPTAVPTPGHPCWTDVQPYPFGIDGNPVSQSLIDDQCPSADHSADYLCYLQVTSMAFRAWNRGLAATVSSNGNNPTSYGVWLYNGARWYPDPTFPGPSTCPGSKVLWAGKLDYWLIGPPFQSGSGGQPAEPVPLHGAGAAHWPTLCRFDGANDQWEPLAVPPATIAKAGPTGAITAGSCFAWNNCWFFGTAGAVVHWDGNALSDDSSGLGASPWLDGDYSDATISTGASGQPIGLAVADANAPKPQPDGAAPPQLFWSDGGPFTPAQLDPSTVGCGPPSPESACPDGGPTNLVAASFDLNGDGWVAGDPTLVTAYDPFNLSLHETQSSPLIPVTTRGTPVPCPGTPGNSFTDTTDGSRLSYVWSSVAAIPDGTALAGGVVGQGAPTPTTEPALVHVSCSATPQSTSFRISDPDPLDPKYGTPVPADVGGYITAVAASAVNDAWASSSTGGLLGNQYIETPHLYQLTDGQPPEAPAGDDNETRPVEIQQEPTIFVLAPPVVIPPPPPPTITRISTKPTRKKKKLPSPIFDVQAPKLQPQSNGTFRLSISFKVRRKVTIGLEALDHRRVVARSGMKTFRGHIGTLAVIVDRSNWPTGLKFVQPGKKR